MINSCKNSKTIGMELKLCMVSLRRSGAQNVPTELHDCNEEISFLSMVAMKTEKIQILSRKSNG